MPIPKDKVLPKLEELVKDSNITKTLKDQLATTAAEAIENEEGIDAYMQMLKPFIPLYGKEGDRRAKSAADTRAAELAKMLEGKTDDPAQLPAPKTPDTSGMTPEMKQMFDLMQEMRQELSGFKQAQTAKSIAERFTTHPDLKGIDPAFFKGRIPTDEAQFDAAVQEAKTDWTALSEKYKFAAFSNETPAGGAAATHENGKVAPASDEAVKAVAALL